jgi:hypothetical protein
MKDYIKSLLPRLRRLSKQLDDEANFVDIPWTFRDDDGNLNTHLFRRNSELLVSINGDVIIGHWEYIPSMNSLLIDYQNKKQLFNHAYLDPDKAVLLLLKDGTDDLHILANRNQIPDLNVIGYLDKKINYTPVSSGSYQHTYKLIDGNLFQIVKNLGFIHSNTEVRINDAIPLDGLYRLQSNNTVYEVKNGCIFMEYYIEQYPQKNGQTVEIYASRLNGIQKGSLVFINGMSAPDGEYKTGWLSTIMVKNGKVE